MLHIRIQLLNQYEHNLYKFVQKSSIIKSILLIFNIGIVLISEI